MTGGRIKRIQDILKMKSFCLTYGDGLADINIKNLIDFHKNKNAATVTAAYPPGRFGRLDIKDKVQALWKSQEGDGALLMVVFLFYRQEFRIISK